MLIARSALVGSLYATIHAECSSSCLSADWIFQGLQRLVDRLEIGLFMEIGLGVDGQFRVAPGLRPRAVPASRRSMRRQVLKLVQLHQKFRSSVASSTALSEFSTFRFSVARRRISRVNSLSSLMYFSLLPFLMR